MVRSIVFQFVFLFVLLSVTGCSKSEGPGLPSVETDALPCAEPAPLTGEPEPGLEDNYFVCFKDGVDVAEEAARLAAAYGFVPKYVYAIIPCMAVRDLPSETVEALRCEPTVDHITYEGSISL